MKRRLVVAAITLFPLRLGASPAGAGTLQEPFTATATLSYTANDLHLPESVRQDVGAFHGTTVIKFQDATHWRVDTDTDAPALEEGSSTDVSDGKTLTTEFGLLGQTVSMPIVPEKNNPISTGYGLLAGYYQPFATSVQDYVKHYSGHGSHARIVDHSTLLGRPVTVIKVWPVIRGSSSSCKPLKSNSSSPSCTNHAYSYGQTMLWVDSQHLLPLRVQEINLPENWQQDLTFEITRITYGQGPSAPDLAFRPPASTPLPTSTGSDGYSTSSPDSPWTVPPGFIPVTRPDGWKLDGEEEGHAPGNDAPAVSESAVFVPHFRSGVVGQSDIQGDYLLVQEQWRANGPPPFFTTGTARRAGSCQVWTGIYLDGTRWLGYTRDRVSLLATTNAFSERSLAAFAAQHICKGS